MLRFFVRFVDIAMFCRSCEYFIDVCSLVFEQTFVDIADTTCCNDWRHSGGYSLQQAFLN